MRKVKSKKKSLVEFRWGDKRSPSKILRVSPEVREIADQIADFDRRRWFDDVVRDAWAMRRFAPVLKS